MPEDEAENSEESPKKGLPLVPIIAVGAVLLIEAVLIVGLFMLSGGPDAATASPGEPCLLYTSPSPRDLSTSRMPSSA